jgi:hypothetical protein
MRRARFADILQHLATNEVELIVVGMTAGITPGSAIGTTKERSGRPKDVAALPVLRATLEERNKGT